MTDVPTTGQIGLLGAAIAFFAVGGSLSLARLWFDRDPAVAADATGSPPRTNKLRLSAKSCLYWGVMIGVAVVVWHAVTRGSWVPLQDNFDTLIWLGVLLAMFVAYTQRARPLRGLDWFAMPIVILLLVGAAIFGRAEPRAYLDNTWSWVHRISSYGGALAFAVAAVAGAMYLIASSRLRAQPALPGPRMGSLERLEHLTFVAVTWGFALLTIGGLTGLAWAFRDRGKIGAAGAKALWNPKVILSVCVWLIYAVVLHAPINPRFRGRKAAVLSVVGFVVMVGVLIAAQMYR